MKLYSEQILSLNFREALQTPGEIIINPSDILNHKLDPPCSIDFNKLELLIKDLPHYPNIYLELPNPISSPTVTQQIKHIFDLANEMGVTEQIAVHVRMLTSDVQQAINCGAKRIYVYAGVKQQYSHRLFDIDTLLSKLFEISKLCATHQVLFLRASLEHASQTELDVVQQFMEGIRNINSNLNYPVIKGVGIPDTNGVAYPQQYLHLIEFLSSLPNVNDLTLFSHLHDDESRALENYDHISTYCHDHHINLCTETIPNLYPGERSGIKPTYTDLSNLVLPNLAKEVIIGTSWLTKNLPPHSADHTHVAGVHTNNMTTYSTNSEQNFPHPGLYTIMGTANLGLIQQLLFQNTNNPEILKSLSLIGREYAAQYGNQKHEIAIKLAKYAYTHPDMIELLNKEMEGPSTWIESSPPSLASIHEALSALKLV